MKCKSSTPRAKQALRRQAKTPQRPPSRRSAAAGRTTRSTAGPDLPDEQWLREMRRMVRIVSCQLDELELIIRAIAVLESRQAVRHWFNGIVPALGARPMDLCQTARGRRAVLRELGRIEHGVHS